MKGRKPDHIGLGDERSFALHTLENRIPSIIDGVAAQRPADDPTVRALAELKDEIRRGTVRDPFADGMDTSLFQTREISAWREEIGPRLGLPWRRLPFYVAEAYLYLRILLAAGYYRRGSPHFLVDPFEASKAGELSRFMAAPETASVLELILAQAGGGGRDDGEAGGGDRDDEEAGAAGDAASGGGAAGDASGSGGVKTSRDAAPILRSAVLFMLKGNRIDLSNAAIAERGRKLLHDDGRGDLLVDHLDRMIRILMTAKRVDLVLDNAGAELAADLVFAFVFLSVMPGTRVVVHAKRAPMFVSDAMPKDLDATVKALEDGPVRRIGRALSAFRRSSALQVRDHFFWNGPKHFTALPPDLSADLGASDLVIFKGDANFRRIVEDRKWPFDTPLEELTLGFPASFAVLRTLKSEVVTDIPRPLAERLFREDPNWLVNGRWGVVRVVETGGTKGVNLSWKDS